MTLPLRPCTTFLEMSPERRSYRVRFLSPAEAITYDENEYSPKGYPALLWQLEQDILRGVVDELRAVTTNINYLDFACGTGRVVSFMEALTDQTTGIEISDAMLQLAEQKVRSAKLVKADITVSADDLSGPFDLITAFRFVLNAEPDLRRAVLRRLAGLLRDDRSALVFNNHINLWSYKVATWPKQRLGPASRRGPYLPNFLTDRAVRRLARECGLTVETVYGIGYLSRRALSLVGYESLLAAERRLAQFRPLNRFGVDQIYVARRMAGGSTAKMSQVNQDQDWRT